MIRVKTLLVAAACILLITPLHVVSADEDPPLIAAVKTRNLKRVKEVLNDETLMQTDKDGTTALMHAVLVGYHPIIQKLLDHGADVNRSNNDLRTPLISAAFRGRVGVIRQLVRLGADIEARDSHDKTAILWGALYGQPKAVAVLAELGANLQAEDHRGNSALTLAAMSSSITTLYKVLDLGADVNHQNNAGQTPLMMAVTKNSHDLVDALLESGADPNLQTKDGETALMMAAFHGHQTVVDSLIEYDADPDLTMTGDRNAAALARLQGHSAIADRLDGKPEPVANRAITVADLQKAAAERGLPPPAIIGQAAVSDDDEAMRYLCSLEIGISTFDDFQGAFGHYFTRETALDPLLAPGRLVKPLTFSKRIDVPPERMDLAIKSMNSMMGRDRVPSELTPYVTGRYVFGHLERRCRRIGFYSQPRKIQRVGKRVLRQWQGGQTSSCHAAANKTIKGAGHRLLTYLTYSAIGYG